MCFTSAMAERMCKFADPKAMSKSAIPAERQCTHQRQSHARWKLKSLPSLTEQMVSKLEERIICAAETTSRQKVRHGMKESRGGRDLRKNTRADRVHWALLQARVPSDEELTTTKRLLQICIIRSVEVDDDQEEDGLDTGRFKTFEELRSHFLRQNIGDLEDAGMGALRAAPVSSYVQNRFLSTFNEYGENSLALAYHGTPTRNHTGIFQSGLRVPGKGSIPVANGSAHGRGIYVAEKGSEALSQGFLRGDKEMLICGVIDNTLVDKEESAETDKAGSIPRFLFRGGYLEHRCHRRPAKVASTLAKQQYLGVRPLLAETKEVRHVGNAMVIFNESHVAPLFVAHTSGSTSAFNLNTVIAGPDVVPMPEPRPNMNRLGQVDCFARGQVVDPESDEQCWLAPEASECSHGIKMKRTFERRRRQKERRHLLQAKYDI